MATKITAVTDNNADTSYGYAFGIDGVVSMQETCKLLGDVSRDTVDRLCEARKLRRGKTDGLVRICRRSLTNYIRSLEQ